MGFDGQNVTQFFNQQNAHFLLYHTTSFYNKINPF